MSLAVKDMMAMAQEVVRGVTPAEAQNLLAQGAVAIDIRDSAEVAASGKVKGALAINRGLLEFKADPALPTYEPALQKDRTIILYCASGGRAWLAGKTLHDMGYKDVRNLGGFKDWVAAGGAVEK
jgi:rhodanese-related sulfurtransferase